MKKKLQQDTEKKTQIMQSTSKDEPDSIQGI